MVPIYRLLVLSIGTQLPYWLTKGGWKGKDVFKIEITFYVSKQKRRAAGVVLFIKGIFVL